MNKLIKAVAEGDNDAVDDLFKEHGAALSVEATDKTGKTLLMVRNYLIAFN
jgi:hypothetical protein